MPMKLKLDDAGHAVLKDGKPIYVKDDGKEIEFDAEHAFAKIGQLTGEAADSRKALKEREDRLKLFEGIEDADGARKALDIVSKLDQKKLIDAGEVDKVTSAAITATEAKYKPFVDRAASLEAELTNERIGGAFARSKTIAEKFTVPADLVQARFGSQFKVEGGKIIAYNGDGQKVFSNKKPGEYADFDEAIEILVDAYPNKASILKGTGAGGGGSGGGTQTPGNGSGGGVKAIDRATYEKMSPEARAAAMKDVRAGKAQLRDPAVST